MTEVGSAAEEAIRLFAAAEDWARRTAGHLLDDAHVATGSAECQVCPLCQGIGVLRHLRPDAVEHLLDAAASLLAALKTAVTAAPAAAPSAGPASRVQRIAVRDAE